MARLTARTAMLPSAPPLPSPDFNPDQVEGWEHEREESWRDTFDETMTTDPAVQIEEYDGLSQSIRDKIKLVPEEVKAEVRRAHHQLGHVGRDAMLRLAKAARKSPDHVFYIRHWRCPMCLRRTRPAAPPESSVRNRATEFGMLVGVDLKEVTDTDGTRHAFLNVLDIATRCSALIRVPSKRSCGRCLC